MNMLNKQSISALLVLVFGVAAPVSASNAVANVPGLSVVAAHVATWIATEVQARIGVAFTRNFGIVAPLVTIDGNHMTIEAKRLPDSAPLRGFSGPRKKQS